MFKIIFLYTIFHFLQVAARQIKITYQCPFLSTKSFIIESSSEVDLRDLTRFPGYCLLLHLIPCFLCVLNFIPIYFPLLCHSRLFKLINKSSTRLELYQKLFSFIKFCSIIKIKLFQNKEIVTQKFTHYH